MPMTDRPRNALSVMVVEDLVDAAESLALLLQMGGYRVVVAPTGEVALELAALEAPDVVLLDLRLPGMDGWEVARRLRERAVRKRPLFVAVTGCCDADDFRRSAEAGVDLHLLKPVDPRELMSVLGRFARSLGLPTPAEGGA